MNISLSLNDAQEYCETEMNGQIWGDIDAPREELAVRITD